MRRPLRWLSLALIGLLGTSMGCVSGRSLRQAEAHRGLGLAYLSQGDTGSAIAELRKAIEIVPRDPDVQHQMAMAYFGHGLHDDAQEHFEKALSLREEFPEANLNYGSMLLADGQLQEALAQFESAASDPTYRSPVRAWHNIGVVQLQMGEYAAARQRFRSALQRAPQFCPARSGLAQVYEAEGALDRALDEWRGAVECAPNDLGYHLELGQIAFRLERFALAREHLEFVRRNDGEYGDLAPQAEEFLRYIPANAELGTR